MLIKNVIKKLSMKAKNDSDLAIQLHDYVRDNIYFGFTYNFDQASITYTLERLLGHCNPKSALLTALFNEAGFEAYQHFIVLKKQLLKGCIPFSIYTLLPKIISHSITDVRLNSSWYSIDSYVIDPVLFHSIQNRLKIKKQAIGFGSYTKATCIWDGKRSAFSQAGETSLLVEDHGRMTDVNDYYRSSLYKNRVLGKHMNYWLRLIGPFGVIWEKHINSVIHQLREKYRASHPSKNL
ncbi:MAG TPA: transglutaminase domain-containing protein [Gammaproteobacteria bacterium]|jgi:hypothetical protein|nr:transglutaminase domain-containing protein [Gammaproteobacteria bacterium]